MIHGWIEKGGGIYVPHHCCPVNLSFLRRHTAVRNKFVVPADAGTQRLKSLDYSIHPCMLPLLHPSMGSAQRASFQLFKFDPVKFVGPAFGCSNLLQADLVQLKHAGMTRKRDIYGVKHTVVSECSCARASFIMACIHLFRYFHACERQSTAGTDQVITQS